ncbi:hypothetical protein TWF569_006385 [Orbilia oligospora]|uniref:Uncharacterized protein n=1 Tax=Orbilia oligospora TaxID=2813651 RepID=A0A7C8NF39_ORBOL|nr:hypothetical protein TWF102_001259 [Orbilia oligospora]KAF3087648.1 hypothetical protein TWF103_001341 [Orbilia oligospora]KAF3139008.1 hypothetical protein TWF594_006768 [Orbilia oligospora]KAF3146374.1 hypothetical protein TWF569_006385 [Orbilia oligospora]
MSHPTHSYSPLDPSTPYNRDTSIAEPQYPPSTPPPLYSGHGYNSNPDSPSKGGYRPESMLYSKQESTSPYLSTEASSTAALLPQSENEQVREKDTVPRSSYDSYNDIDTSYPPASNSDVRSRSLSPSLKGHHYKGKQYLGIIRCLFACFNMFISTASFILIAIVIWGIYSQNKEKTRLAISDPTKPPKDIIRAFPKGIEPLPNNLIITASVFTMVASIVAALAPCWRSNKKFHKKRFAKSEIFEIILNVIIVATGAAAAYFALTTKPDTAHSLWGYTCEIAKKASTEPQRLVFTDINFRNACSNYNAAVYTLMGFTGIAALTLGTFLVNFCLKKKKGEYRRDDSEAYTGVCECCGACAGPLVDCLIICQCFLACFQLCELCK